MPKISEHFKSRKPSGIRLAQIKFAERTDKVDVINTAIGNVSLPMHPAMRERMENLTSVNSPFAGGVVKYSETVGTKEANDAVLNIIASSGCEIDGLHSQITDGGSAAMELVIIGCCGAAGTDDAPLLLIDAAYTNYQSLAERTGRKTVSVSRTLNSDGKFSLPDMEDIEKAIVEHKPSAIVVIPYDNPTGQLFSKEDLIKLSQICVKHDIWIVSDEAYRELYYTDDEAVSIWKITNKDVEGIEGRRISIETASKVWNACGLRIGALVTDNKEYHQKSVAEFTANLCSNSIGQYIFGSLAHQSFDQLAGWYNKQREYYKEIADSVVNGFKKHLPKAIISQADASLYSVVDVRDIVDEKWQAIDFVTFCAEQGKVNIDGNDITLLVSPMAGFYNVKSGENNPGRTQMRIAYVDSPERMKLVPELFTKLFNEYMSSK
jgi:aspartate aminotransferase